MNKNIISIAILISAAILLLVRGTILSQEDRQNLKSPNGLSFADIRGYANWRVIAPSYRPDKKEVRFIVGNEILFKAYQKGVPLNGKPFPDGSTLVKIAFSERKNPAFPDALEPDVLQRVEFMVKDAKRFRDFGGWGYARFIYEPKTDTFKPYGNVPSFANECFQCHTLVTAQDYVFTRYARR
jgi:hypothetical protein